MIKSPLPFFIFLFSILGLTAFLSANSVASEEKTVVIDHFPMRSFFRDLTHIETIDPREISEIALGFYISHTDRFAFDPNIVYYIKGRNISRRLTRAADGRLLNPPKLDEIDRETSLYVLYEGPVMPDGRPPKFTYSWTARIQMELKQKNGTEISSYDLRVALSQANAAIRNQAGSMRLFAPKLKAARFHFNKPGVNAKLVFGNGEERELSSTQHHIDLKIDSGKNANDYYIMFDDAWSFVELVTK